MLVQLDATGDVDMKVETASGETLLSGRGKDNGRGTNWDASALTTYEYEGMTLQFCVDGCDADIVAGPYSDGVSHDVVGAASYASEYVFVDHATEALVATGVERFFARGKRDETPLGRW